MYHIVCNIFNHQTRSLFRGILESKGYVFTVTEVMIICQKLRTNDIPLVGHRHMTQYNRQYTCLSLKNVCNLTKKHGVVNHEFSDGSQIL